MLEKIFYVKLGDMEYAEPRMYVLKGLVLYMVFHIYFTYMYVYCFTESDNTGAIVGGVVGGIGGVLLVLVIIVVVYLCYQKNKNKGKLCLINHALSRSLNVYLKCLF